MQALALFLLCGHEEDLWTLPYAIHLRSYILVPICECVDPNVEQESFIVEGAVPFTCSIQCDMLRLRCSRSVESGYLINTGKGAN